MSISQLPRPSDAAVSLDGDSLRIESLIVTHPEAAALARKHQATHGDDSLTELVRTALPIGIVALTLGGAGMDQSSIMRTFDAFGAQVNAASTTALAQLETTTTALKAGEQDLATRAQRVLERLPEHVTKALSGVNADVRQQVQSATAEVQAAGLRDMRTALDAHAEIVRTAVSLDNKEGPIRALREEVLRMVESSRQELGGQLNAVHGLLMAAQAAATATASVKTTRASGLAFETLAMALCEEVVTAAGDYWEATGASPAPGGGTGRAGDGVATLAAHTTGGRSVRLVLEAKTRSRPLSVAKWREEINASRALRQAAGGLALVPDATQVPGGRLFARLDDRSFIVACDSPSVVSLVYLVLREITAFASADRRGDADQVNLARAESRISQALAALNDLDMVTRHTATANSSLEKIRDVTADVKTRVEATLKDSLAALNISA